MRWLSGEIGPRSGQARFMGELLPLEGWINVELHCHLHEIRPSDRHPDLAQVLLSVPPPEEPGRADQRVEALADYISRTMELGAGIEELEPSGRAEPYRYLAEALVPWLTAVPHRDLKDAWDRGYEAGRRRAEHGAEPSRGSGALSW